MNCNKCGKRIVHPDDYGDYDDACEWSCTCTEHFKEELDKREAQFKTELDAILLEVQSK